jgi:predicted RNA-binding Zn-ribbon protein involved in translation (DUF1610 family)
VTNMPLKSFTRNYSDESSYEGFQFTFHCDLCGDGYKTEFQEAKTHKKRKLLGKLDRVMSYAGVGVGLESQDMTPEWHKEHEKAFELAQNEAMGHFHRCPKCRSYACDTDLNEKVNLCVNCAPREAVEVAAARADKMVSDIREKAADTTVFTGEIDERATLCPQCGKPAGEGKFCNNCGAPLNLLECPKCGAKSPVGTRFCGECGTKF